LIQADEVVTWVKVERPTFDLVGVLLSSLTFAVIAIVVALAMGTVVGAFLIRRARRQSPEDFAPLQLHTTLHNS
jgi:hypothetical protein